VIALVDYGAGNLTSVRKALAALSADVFTPAHPEDLADAAGVIVPGVGHFDVTKALHHRWRDAIGDAFGRGRPLLGICVGLQWLFEGSAEAPGVEGLGLFPGICERLPSEAAGSRLKVPHVGWNSLSLPRPTTLLADIPEGAEVYFTHSYAAPVVEDSAAITTYGVPFTAAVERGAVSGVQFHPEKSGEIGLRVLRNWIAIAQMDRKN
jgi:imidazole glycerol-phosphate synthase subunit HisH